MDEVDFPVAHILLFEEYLERAAQQRLDEPTLRSTSDHQLEDLIMGQILCKIGFDDAREFEIISNLPPSLQAVYTTIGLDAQVCNGGFYQYYQGPSGVYAQLALAGLKLIGAYCHAALLERATTLIGTNVTVMGTDREDDSLEDPAESNILVEISKLEDVYYALEDLSAYRIRYIRENLDQFIETTDETAN